MPRSLILSFSSSLHTNVFLRRYTELHTEETMTRSARQAQISERKRGLNHGELSQNQVGCGVVSATHNARPAIVASRFHVQFGTDPETGEPVRVSNPL